jgi:hypothetical protein
MSELADHDCGFTRKKRQRSPSAQHPAEKEPHGAGALTLFAEAPDAMHGPKEGPAETASD